MTNLNMRKSRHPPGVVETVIYNYFHLIQRMITKNLYRIPDLANPLFYESLKPNLFDFNETEDDEDYLEEINPDSNF